MKHQTDEDTASPEESGLPGTPKIIKRDDHSVSRRNIDQDALKVLNRLNGYGYQAFLVGGGVRDLLLDKAPKDFDIGTSALPEDIKELFRNSRIIGRRFKLVHVYFKGGKIIEVSTFRASTDEDPQTLAHDNTYGDAESDALRRDLTINGLFYNAEDFTVIDYVGGLADLDKKIVRIIGDPEVRFTEDPVRIIRASRHAARADFSIESKTSSAMKRLVGLLEMVPSSRLYEEFTKDLYSGDLRKTFVRHRKYGIINEVLPNLEASLKTKSEKEVLAFYDRLEALDALINEGKDPLTELFYAVMFIGNATAESDHEEKNADLKEDEQCHILAQTSFNVEPDTISAPVFKLRPVRRERTRDRISNLSKEIGNWFLPLTMTKREKMALERLLVLRYRVLTATNDDIASVSELLSSIHNEERENVLFLCTLFGSEIPRGLRGVLGGNRRRTHKPRRQFHPKKNNE